MQNNIFIAMSRNTRNAILFAAAIYIVGVAFLALAQNNDQLLFANIALLFYVFLLLLPIWSEKLGAGWFHPLVFNSLWTLCRFVLPRTPLHIFGFNSHPALPEYSPQDLTYLMVLGLTLESISLVAMYAGFLSIKRYSLPFELASQRPRHLTKKMLALAAVSLIAVWVLAGHAGGLEGLLLQRGLRVDLRAAATLGGHWSVLAAFLSVGCLVWAGMLKDAYKNPLFWAFFSIGLALTYLSTGSRGGVIGPILIAAMIWVFHKRRIPWTRLLVLALVALALLGLMGQYRHATFSAGSLEEIEVSISVSSWMGTALNQLTTYSSESHAYYPIIARVPSEVDLLYGASYASILSAPIPRSLWDGKPIAVGRMASTIFYNNPWNTIPTGSVGEAFWNFHLIGVVLVFFFWGVFLKLLALFFHQNTLGLSTMPLYMLTLYYLEPNTEPFYQWALKFGPALLIVLFFAGVPVLRLKRQATDLRTGSGREY